MEDRKRVLGKVTHVRYGSSDDFHGVFTCWIGLDFEGYVQSFGGIFLDKDVKGPAFRQSLCKLFGVDSKTWEKDLVGKQCYGLYNFAYNNDPIEGLEVAGKRFTITEFARRYESVISPLQRRKQSMENDIVHHERMIADTKRRLKILDEDYTSWE